MSGLGCDEGGFSDCPTPFSARCGDGTRLTPNHLMEWKMHGGEGCPCGDGVQARCDDTGDYPRCPNGALVNREKLIIEDYRACKIV